MSISLMTLAWKVPLPPSQKMALLALCDWANDSGSIFQSIPKVAQRLSRSERQAQRLIHRLIDDGWISVVAHPDGGASARHYQINVQRLKAEAERHDDGQGVAPSTQARVPERACVLPIALWRTYSGAGNWRA